MIFSTGIANVIFAVKFMRFAFCNLGVESICHSNLIIHAIAFLLSIPFALIGQIGFFVASSLISTFFIIMCVISISMTCTFFYIAHGKNKTTNFLDLKYIGEFFGVVCFSIEGIGLMLPIRSSMKTRASFRKTFNGVCAAVIAFYFIYGSIGALAYGHDAKTIILFQYGKSYPLIYPQSLLYAIGIFVSFPYVLFPLAPILRESSLIKACLGVFWTLLTF
jgi:proton-coupled amino acid transporter